MVLARFWPLHALVVAVVTESAYRPSSEQHSRTLTEVGSENYVPCFGAFFAYDSQGRGRGICADCELDADVHEFDLPQDDA